MTELRSPIRTCIACRARREQATFLRFRRRRDGVVVPAVGRRDAMGRGAYVCPSPRCMLDAVRRRAFERALGRSRAGRAAEGAPPTRRGGEPSLVVRVPEAHELLATAAAALDRNIDLLARTGPLCGSPRSAKHHLQGLRAALGQPGRND